MTNWEKMLASIAIDAAKSCLGTPDASLRHHISVTG
jgi:hypothetical protein